MARGKGLSPSTKRSGANHLAPKKGKMPSPHQSPGRAQGARATPTAGVSARPMGVPVGNARGKLGKGAMKSGASSPLTRNKR